MAPNNFVESAAIGGVRLRVEFERQGDRFGHRIVLVEGESLRTLLTTVEGLASDSWPISPVLQHLQLESRDGNRQVALLVGMAGRSHWSMSVEPDANSATIAFDVACRVGGESPRLRSTYQSESDLCGNIVRCVAAAGESKLCQHSHRNWEISPAQIRSTSRWRYRVGLNVDSQHFMD